MSSAMNNYRRRIAQHSPAPAVVRDESDEEEDKKKAAPPPPPSWWPAEPHYLDTLQEREEAESHEEHMERIDAMLSGVEEADSRGYVGREGSGLYF